MTNLRLEHTESPLDYKGSLRRERLQIVDQDAPPLEERYYTTAEREIRTIRRSGKTDRPSRRPRKVVEPGADPGVVAFLDYFVFEGNPVISFISVRKDQRGKGYARRLVDEVYNRFPEAGWVDFGEIHSPAIAKLYHERRNAPEGIWTRGKLRVNPISTLARRLKR